MRANFLKTHINNWSIVVSFKFIGSTLLVSMLMFVSLISSSNAALVTVNNQSLNAYDLDYDLNASTFNEFYNYMGNIADNGTLLPFSSNTGLEVANQIVLMLIKQQEKYGLIGMISGRGGRGGSVTMDFFATDTLNMFIDDPDEYNNGGYYNSSEVKWRYFSNRSDGFVFSGLNSDTWSIDTTFSNFSSSIASDIQVLNFDAQNNPNAIIFGRDETLTFSKSLVTSQASINAPGALSLIFAGFIGLLVLKRRK